VIDLCAGLFDWARFRRANGHCGESRQLCLQCISGEIRMVEPRFGLVEQLDEVYLGACDGDTVLFRQGLELLHGEGFQVGDLAAFEDCLESGVFL